VQYPRSLAVKQRNQDVIAKRLSQMTLSGVLRDIVVEEQSMKAILDRGGDYALCFGVNALMRWVDEVIDKYNEELVWR
jgi:hypothetical protein